MKIWNSLWVTRKTTAEEYAQASPGWTNDYSYERAQELCDQFSDLAAICIPIYREVALMQ